MSNIARVAWLVPLIITASAFARPQPARAVTTGVRLEALHPIERQLREQFPTVALDSNAALEPAQESVAGQMVTGVRARSPQAAPSARLSLQAHALSQPVTGGASSDAISVFYPASYNDPFVVQFGEQRVALRAVGAHFAQAAAAARKLFYSSPHDSVDVIEVPSSGRSEELMLLHDSRAPRVFDYEIVEMRGVAGLSVQDGAIRFAPDHVAVPTASEMVTGRFAAPRPSIQIDRPWVIDANGTRSESAAQWTIVQQPDQPRRIRLTIKADSLAYPLVVDPSFSATGDMTLTRENHTATLLPDGKVLIAGGDDGAFALGAAEVYDPAKGTFTATSGHMTWARIFHTATLLPNGHVLIAGGQGGLHANTADLYDPASGTFAPTLQHMNSDREYHTATLLPNGKVLIAGGFNGSSDVATAELYDPANGTFTPTSGPMTSRRSHHTATLLPSGKVLIAGGNDGSSVLNTAELYDPTSGMFAATSGTMTSARNHHTATLLPNGKVLIAGGYNGSASVNTAELYDSGTFTATSAPMTSARYLHTATLLPSGTVLIAAGRTDSTFLNTAELFDPATGMFTAGGTMTSNRYNHTATLLPGGELLIAGGFASAVVSTAEMYDSRSDTFTATSGTMNSGRFLHTATLLLGGKILLTGGVTSGGSVNTAELFLATSGTFTPTTGTMTSPRNGHTATLLPDGTVLIVGGSDGSGSVNTAELYDPSSGMFTPTNGTMSSVRSKHTATLLRDGRVLIAGGFTGATAALNTAEVYDPATGTFTTTTGPMTANRYIHTATLLPDGTVLIAGGNSGTADLNTAELYDPASGTFSATSIMTSARSSHTATLLPNGEVLIAGGLDFPDRLNTAELYLPGSETFAPTSGNMTAARETHTATLLPGGKVLIAGGDNPSVLNSAELYDPASGTFTATSTLTAARSLHTATLRANGRVLIAGGRNASPVLDTAELYDYGLGFDDARRPVVTSQTNPLCQPANFSLSGSLFTGDSEGSSGSTSSSATNAPLLRLQRIEGQQLQFALAQSFSASSYFSATLSNLSSGGYRAAIVSNAIPSIEQLIDVETTPILATYATASVNKNSSTVVAPSSLPPGYNGAFYPQTASAPGGFAGTLSINGTTGGVSVNNAGPIGNFTITVSSTNSCGSPTTTFTLKVLGTPAAVAATGGTPQSAQVNTAFGTTLQVKVTDSFGHALNNVAVNFTAPPSGASATLPNGGSATTNSSGIASITATANGTLGSYTVIAFVGTFNATFALTNTPATPTNVVATATTTTHVSITRNGTSGATYEVIRTAAGNVQTTVGSSGSGALTDTNAIAGTAYLYSVRATVPSISPFGAPDLATTVIFTDPTLVVGTTLVKAVHITQLRTAVDAVRTLAGLGGGTYTDPTLTAGTTIIKAAHLTDLRSALDAARSATSLMLPAIVYSRPTIAAGTTTISAVDINELRNGVR